MSDGHEPFQVGEDGHLLALGKKIRVIRREQQLTLQVVAMRTGLSTSMISMIERAQTSPSVGSLVAISSALGVTVSDLFDFEHDDGGDPVARAVDHDVVATALGVVHEAVVVAGKHELGVSLNEYAVGGASAKTKLHHNGYEWGIVLDGTLEVELPDGSHVVNAGDSISYDSTLPHRISNVGEKPARAVWINLGR